MIAQYFVCIKGNKSYSDIGKLQKGYSFLSPIGFKSIPQCGSKVEVAIPKLDKNSQMRAEWPRFDIKCYINLLIRTGEQTILIYKRKVAKIMEGS